MNVEGSRYIFTAVALKRSAHRSILPGPGELASVNNALLDRVRLIGLGPPKAGHRNLR
jgi:hypothetical protein